MKQPLIVIFSIIAGYVFATFLSIGLLAVGIDIPAMFANSGAQYDTYGGVEILLMTIGLSLAIYQVLAHRFLEEKAPEPTLAVSSPVATAVEQQPQAPLADTPSPAQPAFIESVSSPVATAVESPSPASQSHVEVHDIQPAVSPPSSGPVVSPASPGNQDASFGPGRWNVLEVRAVPGLIADTVIKVEQSGDSWQFIHPVVGRVASSRVDQTAVQVVGQRVTVTNARDGLSLTLWPVGSARPTASNGRPAVRGRKQWAQRTPWLVAVGVALAWAILSVGPTRLASDIGQLIPRDTVTAPACDCQWPTESAHPRPLKLPTGGQ